MAPLAHALASRGFDPRLVFTGQHWGLDAWQFGLGSFSATRLNCRGEEDPHAHVRMVAAALGPTLATRPDLIVVQGDTSSALGGALAGSVANVPVAHVEAGLRSHDELLPWPEESYRTAIDAQAALLFAPTEQAAANLASEAVGGEVHVTGNTGIDAVLAVEQRLPAQPLHDGGAQHRLLVTCHRRESWSGGLEAIAAALIELAARGARVEVVLHPNPYVASRIMTLLGGKAGVSLVEPCSHAELIERMRSSDLVLSDSGGIQEEAPALGVPLLVLRDKTERPEGVAEGNALLVGTSSERIVGAATRLLDDPVARAAMTRRSFPYGDGRAASRIAAIIDQWLEQHSAQSIAADRFG
jgi:UDP-N-acetylglucosamine 2-epimerase (non-hydrolysing)